MFTTSLPSQQALVDVPAGSPVAILVHQGYRFEPPRSGGESSLTVLDLRSGEIVYEGRESVSVDRVSVQLDPETHKLAIRMDKAWIEITPTQTPLALPSSPASTSPGPDFAVSDSAGTGKDLEAFRQRLSRHERSRRRFPTALESYAGLL